MPFINVSPFHEFLSGMNFILQINVGVVKLTGASGTGKTTLLQELVRSTREAQQDIVAFYSVPASFQQIKDVIRQQLNLDPAVNFHDALLNHILAKPVDQRRLIVVIDNAECVDEATLLAIGHLRSIQHAGQSLIGLVLCGNAEFDRIIRQPEHHMLAHDILLSYELSPLSVQQLPDFCRGCLAARGLDSFVLVADDYKQIMQKSGGLPGQVAELVETYWPEDPEISEPQTTTSLENMTTVAESLFYASPARPAVAPDVTPVVSPDMSSEFLPDEPGQAAAPAFTGQSTTEPATADAATLSSNTEADSSNAAADSSPESQLDFGSGFTLEPVYDFPADTADATSQEISAEVVNRPSEFLTEVSASVVYLTAPETIASAAADSAADTSSGTSAAAPYEPQQAIEDVPAAIPAIEVATVSNDFSGASYDVSPQPQSEVSFDFSSDTPVEIALGLAAEPAVAAPADPPQEAGQPVTAGAASTLAPATAPGPNRLRLIVGTLIAASVLVVVAQILKTSSSTNTTQAPVVAAERTAPASPVQTADGDAVATVSVQQFGEQTAASQPEDPQQVVPQPVATTPARADDTQTAPAPAAIAAAPATAVPVAAPASPVSPEAIAAVAEGVVGAWIKAWQSQDVDAYLAFYHRDFVPPNGASRDGWENNRDRIISSQSSISIDIADFTVVGTANDQVRVQFLLTYRGDNYADRTLKELTLQPEADGALRIIQEQNLRTEAFDPVIEAAASWMPDSASRLRENAERTSRIQPGNAAFAAAAADSPSSSRSAAASPLPAADAETIPLIFNLTTLTDAEVGQVNGTLQAWAQAWQNKDMEGYFSHYHADYKAPEAPSVAQWREERVARITAANQIDISLDELEILQNNDNNLLLELLMEYHADAYADRTLKRMLLSKSAQGQWLITMESNLEVERL